jgi:tetratricopeptide (TPR) repeat protein
MPTNAPTRRNEPCPCGSGLRYKDCHGKLGGDSPGPSIEQRIQRALQLHQSGKIDAAAQAYGQVLATDPGNAIATHYLGMIDWTRGELAEAERKLRASIAKDASIPDFHNNLALLMGHLGRNAEAIAGYRKALAVDPAWYEANNNLGLALEDALDWNGAERAYREALERAPLFAAARQNLARLLLLLGRFAEGWEHYRWRLFARGVMPGAPDPAAPRLPASLAGRRFALLGEQGVGDVLFFLRFAPELARRGAALAFRGEPRLHGMLGRTGLFTLGCGDEKQAAPGLEPVYVGDLPWLTRADDPSAFPPALPLRALDDRVAALRGRLEAAGPKPWTALTWRSGVAAVGPTRSQVKEAVPEALMQELLGKDATWISVQRHPAPGSREALAERLGAPVHDFSGANEDLEDMLAVMDLVDAYVGPSNTNTHLRAGVGKTQTVFVPDPPEWRWLASGSTSPWYPGMKVVRTPAAP